MKRINLGCGSRFDSNWINIDFISNDPSVLSFDLSKCIPFESESFDVVYSSHVLEHFSKSKAVEFINECYRILKKDGIIRIVVPDLETICRLYISFFENGLKGNEEEFQKCEWMKIELLDQTARNYSGGEMLSYWKQNPMPVENFVINRMGSEVKDHIDYFRKNPSSNDSIIKPKTNETILQKIKNKVIKKLIKNNPRFVELNSELEEIIQIGKFRISGEVHQWMYDKLSLSILLKETGFKNIRQVNANESSIPEFNKYLLDIDTNGNIRKPDSLFMEAVK
jgi:predicted SAM-dependent methyltransferase